MDLIGGNIGENGEFLGLILKMLFKQALSPTPPINMAVSFASAINDSILMSEKKEKPL